MLSNESLRQIEEVVRRVVREEFAARHVPSTRSRPARADDASGHVQEALAFLQRIDPEGRMSKSEAADALRYRFPQFEA